MKAVKMNREPLEALSLIGAYSEFMGNDVVRGDTYYRYTRNHQEWSERLYDLIGDGLNDVGRRHFIMFVADDTERNAPLYAQMDAGVDAMIDDGSQEENLFVLDFTPAYPDPMIFDPKTNRIARIVGHGDYRATIEDNPYWAYGEIPKRYSDLSIEMP